MQFSMTARRWANVIPRTNLAREQSCAFMFGVEYRESLVKSSQPIMNVHFFLKTLPVLAAIAIICETSSVAQNSANQSPVSQQTAVDSKSGNSTIRAAAERLLRLPALQAEFRQTTTILQQEILGVGKYRQSGTTTKLFRFDIDLYDGAKPVQEKWLSRLTQINDGRFLFVHRNDGQQKTLTQLDLEKIQKESSSSGRPATNWMMSGGLTSLLSRLDQNFNFEKVESTKLGAMKAIKLTGNLKPHNQPKKTTLKSDSILPNVVDVILADEGQLKWFPHQVVFSRTDKETQSTQKLVSFGFYNVQLSKEFPRTVFQVNDATVKVSDITSSVLNQNAKR